MNISLITFPLISLTILISGCVATAETDPQRVSWNDLFFDHRIQNHLEDRKKFLAERGQELRNLEDGLSVMKKKLEDHSLLVPQLRQSSEQLKQEHSQLESAIMKQRKELENKVGRVEVLKQRRDELITSLTGPQTIQGESSIKLAEYEHEINQLKEEVSVLETTIDRIILSRTIHSLETEK